MEYENNGNQIYKSSIAASQLGYSKEVVESIKEIENSDLPYDKKIARCNRIMHTARLD